MFRSYGVGVTVIGVNVLKNTNESANVEQSSSCVPCSTGFSYNFLYDGTMPTPPPPPSGSPPFAAALGPAVSYLPFAAPPAATHLAIPLPAQATPLLADLNAAATAAAMQAVNGSACVSVPTAGAHTALDPSYSFSNTSSFAVAAASPCLPMFFSSETSFQLSTSPCPSDASLAASQVNSLTTLPVNQ